MIVQGLTESFFLEILRGIHTPEDTYRMALYSTSADLSPKTTAYTTVGEVNGQGYAAGGQNLAGYKTALERGVALLEWATPVWRNSTIAARAGLIFNLSKGNRAVAVLDLGKVFTSTNGDFVVTLPEGLLGIGG